jgi:hypothetical protein
MKTFKYVALAAMAATLTIFTACDKDDTTKGHERDTEGPGSSSAVEVTMVYTSVAKAEYNGDAHNKGLGVYNLTLKEKEGQELFLEFFSPLTEELIAVPDEGEYSFSVDYNLHTFDHLSRWTQSDDNGTTTRIPGEGSFTWKKTEAGVKISGSLVGRDDAKLNFSYEGPIEFPNESGIDKLKPDPDALTCYSAFGTYYGKYYIPSAPDYYIVLYDTMHAKEGDPYNVRICLDFTSIAPAGALMPKMGMYSADIEGSFAEGTFVPTMMDGQSGVLWQTKSGSGVTGVLINDGFFVIRENGGGQYQIFGTLIEYSGAEHSFNYVGPLKFNSEAVSKYSKLTSNYNMDAFYSNIRCYESTPSYNMWKLYLYDEPAWTTGGKDGYFITFDMMLPTNLNSIPPGRYTICEHVLFPKQNEFIAGDVYAQSSAYGSWLATGSGSPVAPFRGGEMNLVDNGNGTYTVTFDVTDDDFSPKRITGSFTGELPYAPNSLIK